MMVQNAFKLPVLQDSSPPKETPSSVASACALVPAVRSLFFVFCFFVFALLVINVVVLLLLPFFKRQE